MVSFSVVLYLSKLLHIHLYLFSSKYNKYLYTQTASPKLIAKFYGVRIYKLLFIIHTIYAVIIWNVSKQIDCIKFAMQTQKILKFQDFSKPYGYFGIWVILSRSLNPFWKSLKSWNFLKNIFGIFTQYFHCINGIGSKTKMTKKWQHMQSNQKFEKIFKKFQKNFGIFGKRMIMFCAQYLQIITCVIIYNNKYILTPSFYKNDILKITKLAFLNIKIMKKYSKTCLRNNN